MINFIVSKTDAELIEKIADIAISRLPIARLGRLTVVMDLTACHANGCPLDLERFLASADPSTPERHFNFAHDILGIINNLDRTTGKLKNCFMPRFAKPEPEKAFEEVGE